MCNRSLLDFDPMVILKAHKFWKNSRRTWGFLLTFLDRLTANYYLKAVNDRDRNKKLTLEERTALKLFLRANKE
jgi:hypothetical protein